MATGKVIAPNIVRDSAGRQIIDVRAGTDRVEGNGTTTIIKVWRSGVQKFSGSGYMEWAGYVEIDGVVEPPPPDPPVVDPYPVGFMVAPIMSDGSVLPASRYDKV